MWTPTGAVTDGNFRNAAALSVDVVGAREEGGSALDKAHAAGEVERRVAIAVTHQRVRVGLEQVLNDLVLAGEHRKVQGRLQTGEGGGGGASVVERGR